MTQHPHDPGQSALEFDDREPIRREDALLIDIDGFEGPLDLLLTLARAQKVDLTKISILALTEQYLGFVAKARTLRLELAADYLVMAAWLAYLKSRLLLPPPDADDEPSGEELAAHLAFRLQRLEAMRQAAANLMARNRLDRDIFARGEPEKEIITTEREYGDNLYDLLSAYVIRRQRAAVTHIAMRPLPVLAVNAARSELERVLENHKDWVDLDNCVQQVEPGGGSRRSVLASSFSACLELAREGQVELQQEASFKPVYVRNLQVLKNP
jgi:segregation and condensation protein A